MNDASNVIITNNQSDITKIKLGKVNNKKTPVLNNQDISQKNNQSNFNNNYHNSKQIQNNNDKSNIQQKINTNSKQNSNIQNDNNNISNKAQLNINSSISFVEKNYFFTLLYRCFPTKIKIFILIIFLIFSIFFLCINLFDYINYWKNNKIYIDKDWLINKTIIFTLQIICSLCMLFFQCIIYIINRGEYHNFILTSIIFIIVFSSLRIFIFVKNTNLSISIIINLVYSLFIFVINIILLMLLVLTNKKKKNVLQNIDEIVNFTEFNMQTQKKEKDGGSNNNSPNLNILKKEIKAVQLVEDANDIKSKSGSQ